MRETKFAASAAKGARAMKGDAKVIDYLNKGLRTS